jgi:phospholipase/carboxylesterase
MLALGEEFDFAVLAPRSTNATWDVIYGAFGVDVARIDAALAKTFQVVNVDSKLIALAGFSDGASDALALGLANGDLFTHVMAFAPGFMVPVPRIGKPRFFMVHGRRDNTLSIEATSRLYVPFLRTLGMTCSSMSLMVGML